MHVYSTLKSQYFALYVLFTTQSLIWPYLKFESQKPNICFAWTVCLCHLSLKYTTVQKFGVRALCKCYFLDNTMALIMFKCCFSILILLDCSTIWTLQTHQTRYTNTSPYQQHVEHSFYFGQDLTFELCCNGRRAVKCKSQPLSGRHQLSSEWVDE